ncbi:MAG: hypothetical protein ACLRZH_16630 [Ruthenibacterium lactatiformans]
MNASARGAEAVWEAADGKPDHPRRGGYAARRPNSAGYGRFRACGVLDDDARERISSARVRTIYALREFRWAYPAFGANALRRLAGKLAAAGYSRRRWCIRAYVSPTADIRPGLWCWRWPLWERVLSWSRGPS